MLRFKNGLLLGTFMSSAGGDTGGGGNPNAAFLATLPEPLRGNGAFKDVKDVSDLATRYADMNKPFAERLPEKYRAEAAFKDIKDLDGLASSYLHSQRLIGRDPNSVVTLPKDEKDADALNAIYEKLGRPKSAEEYNIPPRGDGKVYTAEDTAFQKQVLPILHEAGLSQRQVEAIMPKWDALMEKFGTAMSESQQMEMRNAQTALRTEWGAKYNGNIALADAAIQHLTKELKLGDTLAKELDNSKLGNNPALARIFAHFGAQMQEDGLIGRAGASESALSPNEAKQKIAAQQNDKDFMKVYSDKTASGHADAVALMKRLYEDAYPGS